MPSTIRGGVREILYTIIQKYKEKQEERKALLMQKINCLVTVTKFIENLDVHVDKSVLENVKQLKEVEETELACQTQTKYLEEVSSMTVLEAVKHLTMFEWAYSGANRAVPRNVGPECAYFLSYYRQMAETIVVAALCSYILVKTFPKLKLPEEAIYEKSDRGGKRLLLILLALLWGMEIGFKFASRTVIYLLNPCHVTTLMQIYLLAAPPSKTVTAVFRIHLNLLNGPLLAFLFPETASRQIPVEAALYWIQHGMMFVIPYYLLRVGGVYNIEPFWDFNWAIFSYCLNLLYHFIILQAIAIPAQVNLNHMICPALLDPFEGAWYRAAAVLHQALLCPLLCKAYCLFADFCLTKFPLTKVKPDLKDFLRDRLLQRSEDKLKDL